MTTLTHGNPATTALLTLLDAASAIIQLPTEVRRQAIGALTIQHLLEDAKALDRVLTEKDEGGRRKDEVQTEAASDPSSFILHPSSLNPQNAPKRPRATTRPPKLPAALRTGVLPPIPAATDEAKDEVRSQKDEGRPSSFILHPSDFLLPPSDLESPPHPSNRLTFDAFDKLCRAEMKRLAMDGRMPNARLWDSERSPGLPTLAAVMQRYKVKGLAALADVLGMEPPLTSHNYAINQNGANAIYAKEASS